VKRDRDSELAEQLLELVHRHGWETTFPQLEAELAKAPEVSPALQDLFLGWMASERGLAEQADRHFTAASAGGPSFAAWAQVGRASVALLLKDFAGMERCLGEAAAGLRASPRLAGIAAHIQGTAAFHRGEIDRALGLLCAALEASGDGFYTGRVLDSLGALYAAKDNFHAAQQFFAKSVEFKLRLNDKPGLAVAHGQLGRLHFGWGYWHRAQEHFEEDLRLAREVGDEFGQARMYGNLGQLALVHSLELARQGDAEQADGRQREALGWLEACVRRCEGTSWKVCEGYAHKDLARLFLNRNEIAPAEQHLNPAKELFTERHFAEGLAHVARATGHLYRLKRQWGEAHGALLEALKHFLSHRETVEVAHTQLEIARTFIAAGEPEPVVRQALLECLDTAEISRRAVVVREVEHVLKTAVPEAYWRHIFHRVRGRNTDEDVSSLIEGTREVASVIFLDIQGSTEFARGRDPADVMMTINQMMGEMVAVLRRHDAQTSIFRGDGFLAIVRGSDHAARAVDTGLDLVASLREFNEPRAVLKLPLFQARIGISTGEVFIGNVGTYDKMDYTGLSTAVNLGARLESNAIAGFPCISEGTHELVKDRFRFAEGNPRTVTAKGLERQTVWDVTGRLD
jgi:class 3 adenylate cyclase